MARIRAQDADTDGYGASARAAKLPGNAAMAVLTTMKMNAEA